MSIVLDDTWAKIKEFSQEQNYPGSDMLVFMYGVYRGVGGQRNFLELKRGMSTAHLVECQNMLIGPDDSVKMYMCRIPLYYLGYAMGSCALARENNEKIDTFNKRFDMDCRSGLSAINVAMKFNGSEFPLDGDTVIITVTMTVNIVGKPAQSRKYDVVKHQLKRPINCAYYKTLALPSPYYLAQMVLPHMHVNPENAKAMAKNFDTAMKMVLYPNANR